MRLQPLLLTLGAFAAGTAIACGGGGSTDTEPTVAPSATETPAPTATVDASTQLAPGRPVRSPDGILTISSTGGSPMTVVMTRMSNVPAAPAGWTISGPVFDITARSGERAIAQLDSNIDLSFKAPAGPALVVYHDGKNWVPVESVRNADGTLSAKTDHLTPYAVAVPKSGGSPEQHDGFARPSVTVSATRSSTPGAVATAATSRTPGAVATDVTSRTPGAVATDVTSRTPGAVASAIPSAIPSVTLPAGSPVAGATATQAAEDALEKAGAKYKGRSVVVSNAIEYSATIIGSHTTTVYAGFYGGVNEIVTTGASNRDDAGDSYTFLSEPKMAMPTSTSDAQAQLAKLFPGATGVKYKVVEETPTRYVFKFEDIDTRSMIGFVTLEGVPVAFMATGTGQYGYVVEQLSLE